MAIGRPTYTNKYGLAHPSDLPVTLSLSLPPYVGESRRCADKGSPFQRTRLCAGAKQRRGQCDAVAERTGSSHSKDERTRRGGEGETHFES